MGHSGPAAGVSAWPQEFQVTWDSCFCGFSIRRQRRLGSSAKLLSDNAAEGFLQGFLCVPDMLPENFVEQRLVVAAARTLDLRSEPSENLVVDSNCDPCFSPRNRDNRAALGIAKIIFTFQGIPHIGSSPAQWQYVQK